MGQKSERSHQAGNRDYVYVGYRNSEGELLKLSTGVLPTESSLENNLNAIHHGLKKGFEDNYKEIIHETDNLDAFKVIKNLPLITPQEQEIAKIVKQIYILLHDPRWICTIAYIN
ncbi:hypothetical protein POM88_045819 [Heracleum sosnowskyi]|uniref:RNase H type-1 domain-containing protein n=1 Tax=Heracleum sosnowskyi TaxID=360622 RepID=A0AAD8H845_9APIA|nr:hypothetical protein POM88_045819 [Heracleum sosnowskyi]